MPIVGVNFTKIEGHVNDQKIGAVQINVSSSPKIKNVTKKEISMGNIKSVLEMDFEFEVKYDPDVGAIKLTGQVLYHDANPDKIVKAWKEKKELDESIAVDVMNVVFRQSLTKAVVLSGDLRLPPPIRFPIVQGKAEEIPKKK